LASAWLDGFDLTLVDVAEKFRVRYNLPAPQMPTCAAWLLNRRLTIDGCGSEFHGDKRGITAFGILKGNA
jgi:hypothetical protein